MLYRSIDLNIMQAHIIQSFTELKRKKMFLVPTRFKLYKILKLFLVFIYMFRPRLPSDTPCYTHKKDLDRGIAY